jgi:hypothetical protein
MNCTYFGFHPKKTSRFVELTVEISHNRIEKERKDSLMPSPRLDFLLAKNPEKEVALLVGLKC